jgi:shikimate kinase
MNIVLCGHPFSGKTTFGKQAALQLGCPFLDTDRLIEEFFFQKEGQRLTCREIHEQYGESIFRDFERQSIVSLQDKNNYIIALGGSALMDHSNRKVVNKVGFLIYLQTPLPVLIERLLKSPLPSYLRGYADPIKAYEEKMELRFPVYQECADKIIDTTELNTDQILATICECYGK